MRIIFFWIVILFFPLFANAQTMDIAPAPHDKSVVYFVRADPTSSLIHFTYFDSTRVIGVFNGEKYMRYECEPGKHLFWAKSQNRSFVRANLEPGKIYIIEVLPQLGFMEPRVKLVPVNSSEYNLKRIQKLLARRPSEIFFRSELNAHQYIMNDVMVGGMDRLEELEDHEILRLGNYSVEPKDLVFKKKKKEKKKKQK